MYGVSFPQFCIKQREKFPNSIYSLFPLYQRLQHDSEQNERQNISENVYTYDTNACYNQQERSDFWKSHPNLPFKMFDLGSLAACPCSSLRENITN